MSVTIRREDLIFFILNFDYVERFKGMWEILGNKLVGMVREDEFRFV